MAWAGLVERKYSPIATEMESGKAQQAERHQGSPAEPAGEAHTCCYGYSSLALEEILEKRASRSKNYLARAFFPALALTFRFDFFCNL